MPSHFDAIVIGGGPSGSVAAYILSTQGMKVLVCERSRGFYQKTGECLAPGVTRSLRSLGLGGALDCQPISQGIRLIWGTDKLVERRFIFEPHGNAYLLDRARFDRSLARAATDRGATWLGGVQLLSAQNQGSIWKLVLRDKTGIRFELECQIVIDASGRSMRLGSQAGASRHQLDNLVAILARFDSQSRPIDYQSVEWYDVEAMPDGWWYSAPLTGGKRLVMKVMEMDLYLSRRRHSPDLALMFAQELNLTSQMSALVGEAKMTSEPICRDASSTIVDPGKEGIPGWIAIGDAAATFDPITSHGLAFAVGSAYYGACAALDSFDGNRKALQAYWSMIHAHTKNSFEMAGRHYKTESRWPDADFWKHRHI